VPKELLFMINLPKEWAAMTPAEQSEYSTKVWQLVAAKLRSNERGRQSGAKGSVGEEG
jgi:hypothetical protein